MIQIPIFLLDNFSFRLIRRNAFEFITFSFAYWPFSIKLLWAPIVDSIFIGKFGRRKTWLVPVQYLIGATMFVLSKNVDFYLEVVNIVSNNLVHFYFYFNCETFFGHYFCHPIACDIQKWTSKFQPKALYLMKCLCIFRYQGLN